MSLYVATFARSLRCIFNRYSPSRPKYSFCLLSSSLLPRLSIFLSLSLLRTFPCYIGILSTSILPLTVSFLLPRIWYRNGLIPRISTYCVCFYLVLFISVNTVASGGLPHSFGGRTRRFTMLRWLLSHKCESLAFPGVSCIIVVVHASGLFEMESSHHNLLINIS